MTPRARLAGAAAFDRETRRVLTSTAGLSWSGIRIELSFIQSGPGFQSYPIESNFIYVIFHREYVIEEGIVFQSEGNPEGEGKWLLSTL
jgi:hypothetical protein